MGQTMKGEPEQEKTDCRIRINAHDPYRVTGGVPLETRYPGVMPVEIDEGEGQPSRWNTLRALRVLDWYSA